MAGQDLQSILAALAATGAASTPSAPQAQPYPPPGQGPPPHGYPGMPSATPQVPPPYGLPQPTSGGSFNLPPGPPGGIDLNNLPKPTSTGSLNNFTDVMGSVRDRAANLGVPPPHSRPDPRMQQHYGQPRSRSRSPPRGSYNPYRDERRGGAGGYNNGGYRERTRSRSPARRYNNFSPSMNRGRERSPARDSEVIEMDPTVVGLVIGRQGENLKRIEKMTGCKIQFITPPEGGGTRRQCRVDGPPSARKDAISEIFRTIAENERGKQGQSQPPQYQPQQHNRGSGGAYSTQGSEMPELRPGETQQQMMVPDKTVGLIIGRGGETIRDLQERSGCHINIVGENKSVGGLRPVNLIGTPAAAEQAKQLILDIVASDERPENNTNRNQNRSQAPPQQHQPMEQGKINESIHVPSEAVGMIIGKGGETIKNMQNDTGCKINVSQPSGPDFEREIGLIGTRQAIESAKRAIWEKVDTVREKSGGGGRGGPNNSNSNNARRDDGGGYGNRYSQPQQQQQSYGQPPAGQQQGMTPTGASNDPNAPDPYQAWGGYANYVAWYYSSLVQGGGSAPGGAPAAGGRAPGS